MPTQVNKAILNLDMHPEEAVHDTYRELMGLDPKDPSYGAGHLDVEPGITVFSFNPDEAKKPPADRKRYDVREPMNGFPGHPDGNADECRVDRFMEAHHDLNGEPSVVIVEPHSHNLHGVDPWYEGYEFASVGKVTTLGAFAILARADVHNVVVGSHIASFNELSNLVTFEFSEVDLPDKVRSLHEGIRSTVAATAPEASLSREYLVTKKLTLWHLYEVLVENDQAKYPSETALVLDLDSQGDVVAELEKLRQSDVAPFDTATPIELSDRAREILLIRDKEAFLGLKPYKNMGPEVPALGKTAWGEWRKRCLITLATPIEADQVEVVGSELVIFHDDRPPKSPLDSIKPLLMF